MLEGSEKGIEFYVGSFDFSTLLNAELWRDAVAIQNQNFLPTTKNLNVYLRLCKHFIQHLYATALLF